MNFIKKIIREELEKVLDTLSETDFYKLSNQETVVHNPKADIIYDYEAGRAFGNNILSEDIVGLNRYNLIEYLPRSVNEESWSFEFGTVYGTTLIVDIKRQIQGSNNIWSIKFGQLYKEEELPQLIAELTNSEGYERFVSEVNNKVAPKIDPSKY